MKRYELITFGENMIRLSTREYERLEQAQTLDMRHGGTEANVAVGLARLGHRTAWVSRLVDNALGQKIARDLQNWGVDTQHIVWTDEGRVGVFFLEVGVPPRASTILYDRRNSSMSQMRVEEFPWPLLEDAGWLHLTGITAALSASCYALVREAQQRARAAGLTVSFDLNYRARLWPPEQARAALEPLCRAADVLFVTQADAALVLGIDHAEPEAALRALAAQYAQRVVAMTVSAAGALAIDKTSDTIFHAPAVPLGYTVDRVGAGDAFAAGFIAGYLEESIARGLKMGTAMAALKMTVPGDYALVTRAEVEALLAGSSGSIRR